MYLLFNKEIYKCTLLLTRSLIILWIDYSQCREWLFFFFFLQSIQEKIIKINQVNLDILFSWVLFLKNKKKWIRMIQNSTEMGK